MSGFMKRARDQTSRNKSDVTLPLEKALLIFLTGIHTKRATARRPRVVRGKRIKSSLPNLVHSDQTGVYQRHIYWAKYQINY